MPSRAVVMSVGLIAVGLLVAGYGVAGSLGSSQCGTVVDVHRADGQNSLPEVQFDDLTEREQQLFTKARNAGGTDGPLVDGSQPSGFENPRIVVYQGERYRAGLVSNDGCFSPLSDVDGVPIAGGSLLLVAGVYGAIRTRRE